MNILIIAICLVLSAICSATETAFSSCNRIRLKKLAEDGSKSAAKALKICENFDKALTAILIGNNVVNIASSSLATVVFTEKFGSGSVGMATLVMTVLVLIFGEILPKSLAKENSESFSIFMAAPLSAFMFIIPPLTAIFMGIKNGVTKLVGKKNNEPSVTEEELKVIIDEIEDEGVLESQESNLVRSALDFDETTIGQILVPRVNITAINIDDDAEKIRETFTQTSFSRLPVYEGDIDHIVGVLHQTDFFPAYISKTFDIKEAMSEPLYFSEGKRISEILKIMQTKKVHMSVVVDQHGDTEGICTLEDILEELVGEIYDESDEVDQSFVKISENCYDVSAELSIEDLLEKLEMDEDTIETERNSVGGWVMDLLDRIPEQNEKVDFPPFHMTVQMEDEQKIGRIKIYINKQEMENQEKISEEERTKK